MGGTGMDQENKLLLSKPKIESESLESRLSTAAAQLAMAYAVVNKPVPENQVLKTIARDLVSQFSDEQIGVAIKRVMRECEWVTLKVIIDRIPGTGHNDGRPEPETAWALCPKTEAASVVWTEEMATAFGVARLLLRDGDPIAARMAFREAYIAELAIARRRGIAVKWEASLGHDRYGRVAVLRQAADEGRISHNQARALLGELADELGPQEDGRALSAHDPREELTEETKKMVARMPSGIAKAFAALVKEKAMDSGE
jgi:hypothetical protein